MQPLGSYIADTVSIKDTKKGVLFMTRKLENQQKDFIEYMNKT